MPHPIRAPAATQPSPQKIVLDWKAYFLEFCRKHGEPVQHGNRLIFKDGWTYSAFDYAGPEWHPPTDIHELDALVTRYWLIRQGIASRLLAIAVHDLQMLKDAMQGRDLPLQQVMIVEEKVQGGVKKRRGYKALSLQGLETRIQWLRDDVKEAEERLAEIEDYHKQKAG